MERRNFLKLFSAAGALIVPGVAPAIIHNAMPVRATHFDFEAYGKIVVPFCYYVEVGCIDITRMLSNHREVSQMISYYRQFRDGRCENITKQEYEISVA